MKILVLNWKDPMATDAGGAERYVQRVAEHWSKLGHDVTCLVSRVPGLPADEVRHGVRYLRRGSRHTVFPLARAHVRRHGRTYDRVIEAISTRPFFAHECTSVPAVAVYMQLAAEVWNHEFPLPIALAGRYLVEPIWLRRLRRASVVAISPSTAADLRTHGVGVIGVVPPGTDTPVRDLPRSGPPPRRLIFIGRLVRTKRVADAIDALAVMREAEASLCLDVVGAGYLLPQLQEKAAPGVTLHGAIPDAEKTRLLDCAGVMLLPATREGWGIVAMEAAARGLPVVAYDVAGLRDAVVPGVTGLLTAPDPRSLADAARGLLADPAKWSRMSAAAVERAAGYTWAAAATQLLEVLEAA